MSEVIGKIDSPVQIVGKIEPGMEIKAEIIGTGPRGEKGDKGDPGAIPDAIPAAAIVESSERVFLTADEKANLLNSHYIHDQILASANWNVRHNLGKYPSVSVVDSAGSLVQGDVEYLDTNTLTITFTAEFSGKAYLN